MESLPSRTRPSGSLLATFTRGAPSEGALTGENPDTLKPKGRREELGAGGRGGPLQVALELH